MAGQRHERFRVNELTGSFEHDPLKTITLLHDSGTMEHVLPELAALQSFRPPDARHPAPRQPRKRRIRSGCIVLPVDHRGRPEKALNRLKATNEQTARIVGIVSLQARISDVTKHMTLDVLKRMMRDPHFQEALKLYGFRVAAHDPTQTLTRSNS